jgi:hypothetical protein
MSFPVSFHQGRLGPTGVRWLDDPPDLTCKDRTRQYPVKCRLGVDSQVRAKEVRMSNPHIELGREEMGSDEDSDPFTEAEQEPAAYEDERPGLPEEREQQ